MQIVAQPFNSIGLKNNFGTQTNPYTKQYNISDTPQDCFVKSTTQPTNIQNISFGGHKISKPISSLFDLFTKCITAGKISNDKFFIKLLNSEPQENLIAALKNQLPKIKKNNNKKEWIIYSDKWIQWLLKKESEAKNVYYTVTILEKNERNNNPMYLKFNNQGKIVEIGGIRSNSPKKNTHAISNYNILNDGKILKKSKVKKYFENVYFSFQALNKHYKIYSDSYNSNQILNKNGKILHEYGTFPKETGSGDFHIDYEDVPYAKVHVWNPSTRQFEPHKFELTSDGKILLPHYDIGNFDCRKMKNFDGTDIKIKVEPGNDDYSLKVSSSKPLIDDMSKINRSKHSCVITFDD